MPSCWPSDSLKRSFFSSLDVVHAHETRFVLVVTFSRSTSKWGRSSRVSKALCFHSASRGGHMLHHLSVKFENTLFIQQVAVSQQCLKKGANTTRALFPFSRTVVQSIWFPSGTKKKEMLRWHKHSWKRLVAQLLEDVTTVGGCWSATERPKA